MHLICDLGEQLPRHVDKSRKHCGVVLENERFSDSDHCKRDRLMARLNWWGTRQ